MTVKHYTMFLIYDILRITLKEELLSFAAVICELLSKRNSLSYS